MTHKFKNKTKFSRNPIDRFLGIGYHKFFLLLIITKNIVRGTQFEIHITLVLTKILGTQIES